MRTSFRACSSALWRPIRAVIAGFIRNPQAVLLLAACPTPKSDRLLGAFAHVCASAGAAMLSSYRSWHGRHQTGALPCPRRRGLPGRLIARRTNLCKRSVSES